MRRLAVTRLAFSALFRPGSSPTGRAAGP
jgi:hypothetical protein